MKGRHVTLVAVRWPSTPREPDRLREHFVFIVFAHSLRKLLETLGSQTAA